MPQTDLTEKELLSKCMSAADTGFQLSRVLGTYQTYAVLTGAGWKQTGTSPLDSIRSETEHIRALGRKYPQLRIRYPQKQLSAQQAVGDCMHRTNVMQAEAVIDVPEEFVRQHSGFDFRALLSDVWKNQTDELVKQVTARLHKYELRTARMIGRDTRIQAAVSADCVHTAIWQLPLAKCGLYPLQWDGEICGMASLLTEHLRETLTTGCGDTVAVSMHRDDGEQLCFITIDYHASQE